MNKVLLSIGTVAAFTLHLGAQSAGPAAAPAPAENPPTQPPPEPPGIWSAEGVGHGFRAHVKELGASLGAGISTDDIGGKETHDMMLGRVYYGVMLGNPVALDKWYGGNWEFMQEVFGAWQFHPASRYLTGTTSFLRYNFATGTRWVPFLDGGIGLSATDIANPDLGSTGEFNGQIGPGLQYFWSDHTALTMQYRYMHTSDGGLSSPNQGLNENILYVGVTWVF